MYSRTKTKIATIIPFEYFNWGKTMMVYVDKDDPSPDPARRLLWGYDRNGNLVPGDYKGKFTRKGRPIEIKYTTEGWGASEERKDKIRAIERYLRTHK